MPGGDFEDPRPLPRVAADRGSPAAQEDTRIVAADGGERGRLRRAKAKALEDEDFVLAKLLNARLDALDDREAARETVQQVAGRHKTEIDALEEQKRIALQKDDFEFAECIQKEIVAWRKAVQSRSERVQDRVAFLLERQTIARNRGNVDEALQLQDKIQDLEHGIGPECGAVVDLPSGAIAVKLMKLEEMKAVAKREEDIMELRRIKAEIEGAAKELRDVLLTPADITPFDGDEEEESGLLSDAASRSIVVYGKQVSGSDEEDGMEKAKFGRADEPPSLVPRVVRILCFILPFLLIFGVVANKVGWVGAAARLDGGAELGGPAGAETPETALRSEPDPMEQEKSAASAAALGPAPTDLLTDTDFEPAVGEVGRKRCPLNSKALKDALECEQAAAMIAMQWAGTSAIGAGPRGCLIREGAVIWNPKEISAWPTARRVCKQLVNEKSAAPKSSASDAPAPDHHPP
mmetsp:Transcript_93291/g.241151  ORF Transcript_93291/g.241151 Transcript_93291/m.241151 type:complete len:464 (-) Transcript_93291:55-1446(-)